MRLNTDGWAVDLGLLSYPDALQIQNHAVEARAAGAVPNLLLLVEHPPTVTLGRSAHMDNLLAEPAAFAAAGIQVFESNRGGDVTYHGPGQLVGYPIFRLTAGNHDVHAYLRALESALIHALQSLGVVAHREPELTGVWVGDHKVAAIGVAVRHWVTMHGFALNLAPNMAHFRLIRPCGLADRGVTSLAELLSPPPVKTDVSEAVVAAFSGEFGVAFTAASPAQLRETLRTTTSYAETEHAQ